MSGVDGDGRARPFSDMAGRPYLRRHPDEKQHQHDDEEQRDVRALPRHVDVILLDISPLRYPDERGLEMPETATRTRRGSGRENTETINPRVLATSTITTGTAVGSDGSPLKLKPPLSPYYRLRRQPYTTTPRGCLPRCLTDLPYTNVVRVRGKDTCEGVWGPSLRGGR